MALPSDWLGGVGVREKILNGWAQVGQPNDFFPFFDLSQFFLLPKPLKLYELSNGPQASELLSFCNNGGCNS